MVEYIEYRLLNRIICLTNIMMRKTATLVKTLEKLFDSSSDDDDKKNNKKNPAFSCLFHL